MRGMVAVALALALASSCTAQRGTPSASVAKGELAGSADQVPVGSVKGTPEAIASMGKALPAAPGPNRTVQPCRDAVAAAAGKLGAREVDAASAGPEARTPKGNYVALVLMRISYARPTGQEVKLSTIRCMVSPDGKLIYFGEGR